MNCELCQAPKTVKSCELCGKRVCKNCVQFLEKEEFRYLPKIPKSLQHKVYCHDCFEARVRPEKERYEEVMEAAREVVFLSKNYRGLIPVKRKAKEPVSVKRHADKKEAVLHLKFLAALAGYNAVIYGETDFKKIRDHAWETKEWSATGVPAFVDIEKMRFYED